MQMIDVLKRLAELDAGNPNVENKMGGVENLLTVSNVDGEVAKINEDIEAVEECGPMGMGAPMPNHTPASINMTANSGEELSNMLRDIMSLAGVNKDEESSHRELELEPAHAIDSNADMLSSIKVIDSMNEPTNEFDVNPDDEPEEAMYDEPAEEGMYVNSPEEEIEAHDYGDKQVTPQPQGFKQRVGDNPYAPARESVESLANRLLSEFHEFVSEGKKAKPDFLDMDKDGNKKEPMKKAVADRKSKKKIDEVFGFSAAEKNLKVIKNWMDEPSTNTVSPMAKSKMWPDNDSKFKAMPAGRRTRTEVFGELRGDDFALTITDLETKKQQFFKYNIKDPEFARQFNANINQFIGPVQTGNDKSTSQSGQYQVPNDWGKKAESVEEGILHRGAAWLAKKLSSFAGYKALKPGTYIIPPLEPMGGKPISFTINSKGDYPNLNMSGQERNDFNPNRLYDHIKAHIQSGNYEIAPSAMQRNYSQKMMPKDSPRRDDEVVSELTKGAKWKYTDAARKSVNDLADKATKAGSRDDSTKLINKALKRQRSVDKVEKNLVSEEVDEGFGKALLGGAALIAAITGINKMQANHMMKTEPQLVVLAQMRQEAFIQNDEEKVKELDDRIQKTMDHISVTGRPVMGADGLPVDPRKPVGEAKYKARKVPLNKTMKNKKAYAAGKR